MFFTVEKITKQIELIHEAIHREVIEVENFRFHPGDLPGAEASDFDDSSWEHFEVGGYWGGYDEIAWFRTWIPIPEDWQEQAVALRFLVGPRDGGKSTAETMLFVNGKALQAIDVWHETARLPHEALHEPRLLVALRAWSGVYGVPERRHFKLAQLVRVDPAAWSFYYRAKTLLLAIEQMNERELRRVLLLEKLNEAFLRLDLLQPGSDAFYESIVTADETLQRGLAQFPEDRSQPKITGVGHSHIDMAWLWRLKHTREKAIRTFTTALHLMNQYPEYRYTHTTPQLYQFVQQDAPELFERVQQHVASGQWEVTGGMWVEADTLIPSGEALVRQILFGQRYFRETFGHTSKVLWLPDSFGFSWTLPQLMKLSGLKYFSTAILHWSRFNRFPLDTFRWRGIDGSEVLANFITTPGESRRSYTYIGRMEPDDVKGAWENYRQKQINDELLLPFGWGDGGGGPTADMLEMAKVQGHIPGNPRVRMGSIEEYYARLEQRLAGEDVPVWDGELYLELLRGSYTSQSRNKRANRKAEVLYHNAEWLAALADILNQSDAYPREALRTGWEILLLNQFHDILAGTSIRDVHADSLNQLGQVHTLGEQALQAARQRVLENIRSEKPGLVVFNGLGWERSGLARVPWRADLEGQTLTGADGTPLLQQRVTEQGQEALLLEVHGVPGLGYQLYDQSRAQTEKAMPPGEEGLSVTPEALENHYYRIEIGANGRIYALFDKLNRRQVLAPEQEGNRMEVFEDRSIGGEAWEIDLYYQEKSKPVTNLTSAVVEENGPLRGVLRLKWRFGQSSITQWVTLYRSSPRIDFVTLLDWHEHQTLLKAAFPLQIRATQVRYEIQFGSLERPTHWNTSWDVAHFENPAHKWVDLSEGNYGAALLNDSKYGYDVKDNVLRITLHRSPTGPDPEADQGEHHFTYSLLPHAGEWLDSPVVQEAYDLNNPLQAAVTEAHPKGSLPAAFGLAQVEAGSVILETVKASEDAKEGAWILRVYEYQGSHAARARICFGSPLARAAACNLLEEEDQPMQPEGDQLVFAIKPFEIKTFKVWLKGDKHQQYANK